MRNWYSLTEPAIRYRAPSAPGILAVGLSGGELLLVRASPTSLRADLLRLLRWEALVEATDTVFSFEVQANRQSKRALELVEAMRPRWGPRTFLHRTVLEEVGPGRAVRRPVLASSEPRSRP